MLSRFVTDPAFFRRCLVVHVDLSLVVWIYSVIAALSFLLPRAGRSSLTSRASVFVAMAGVLCLLLSAGARGAQPVLANYVPVIDHPLFDVGLWIFAAGVVLSILDRRLLPGESAPGELLPVPAAAVPGLRATAVALLLALLTFVGSWLARPSGLEPATLYELGNWGGGHVLQLASTAAMLTVWLVMLGGVLGRSPLSRGLSSLLFGLLLLPWTAAPWLAARGMQHVASREAFTLLMRWGIFPAAACVALVCLTRVVHAFRSGRLGRRELSDPRLVGFLASAGLTLLGWALGALIRGSTTVIPAHYHASIGGVTVAFMAISYPLFARVGVPVQRSRLARRTLALQPALFGVGQSVFAIGFALAGAHGMGRKLYGAEQHARTLGQKIGLGVMGLGGLTAIAAGVLFLVIVVGAWLRRDRGARSEGALGSISFASGKAAAITPSGSRAGAVAALAPVISSGGANE
jgi:hypothetical protein